MTINDYQTHQHQPEELKKHTDVQRMKSMNFSQEAMAFDIIELVLMVFLTQATGCRRMPQDATDSAEALDATQLQLQRRVWSANFHLWSHSAPNLKFHKLSFVQTRSLHCVYCVYPQIA